MIRKSISPPNEIDGQCESRTTADPVQNLPAFLKVPQVIQHRDEENATQSKWIRQRAEEACMWEDEGGLIVTPLSCSQQSDGK